MRPLVLKGHTRPLTCVKYNREGDLLFSAAKDNVPTVWFTDSGERLGTFDGHKGTVWTLDVDSDSKFLITGGADMKILIWSVETGKKLLEYDSSGPVRCVEWAEGGEQFLITADPFAKRPGKVLVYNFDRTNWLKHVDENGPAPDADKDVRPIHTWEVKDLSTQNKITCATWTALNENIITADDIGVLRLHEVTTGAVSKELIIHTARVNSLAWNKDKTLLLSGSTDCTSRLIDPDDWTTLKKYVSNTAVNSVAISPIKEHVLVAGGQEAKDVTTTSARVGKFETKFFHMVFCEEFGTVKGHFGPVNSIAIHPDGIGFTTGAEDGYIRIHKFDPDYFTMHSELDDISYLDDPNQSA